jgi:DNA-binding transcriptional MerR regulator/ABC-type Fe3+-hydroxamate transport system substrate-binding protein
VRTIGEVADLAGTTVKTLHYYDQIGLLKPLARSEAGYRLYGREELLRLREIMIWRRLGFPLADIAALIDEPDHDREDALQRQLELADSQLDKFQGLTRGLKTALAAVHAGGSPTEDEVFVGFARSLVEDEAGRPFEAPLIPSRRIATFSRLSGRSPNGTADGLSDAMPKRIVATDPLLIAENLLALGVLPVASGTVADHTNGGSELYWPWPDLVEDAIRDRIQNVGWYGTDRDLIERAEPDLILDLRYRESGETQAGDMSDGRCGYGDLCGIAPTVLLDVPLAAPGLLERLEQLATATSVEERVAPLMASWNARIQALRDHVAGETVSACLLWEDFLEFGASECDVAFIPREEHESQLFTLLGMELTPPPEGRLGHLGGYVYSGVEGLSGLTAPTLFLTLDHIASERLGPLLSREPLSKLPAVRQGRVFDLRWTNMRGGWFSYHWRLDVIARAFGVRRLRSGDPTAPVHLAAAPSGKVTVAPTRGGGVASLSGPRLSELWFEIADGVATEIDVGDAAAGMSLFPEAYSLRTDRGATTLMHDRESALERVSWLAAAKS